MANLEIGNLKGTVHASSTVKLDSNTNYDSIANMRTRLAAISGTTYTSKMLDTMSMNDMQYALRVNDNPTTIKQ